MKRIYFLIALSLAIFVPCCNLFAENEESYSQNEQILQSEELPPVPSEAKAMDRATKKKAIEQAKEEVRLKIKEARCEEEKLKAAKAENKRMKKKIAEEKTLEEMRAKKAERAKLEQELEQKKLADVERRERLYKKIGGIEDERNAEYLKKHGTSLKQETSKRASLEKNMPEDTAELMRKGDDLYNSGDYDSAREHYDKARFLLEEKNKNEKK